MESRVMAGGLRRLPYGIPQRHYWLRVSDATEQVFGWIAPQGDEGSSQMVEACGKREV
jgi:hypothetical protein